MGKLPMSHDHNHNPLISEFHDDPDMAEIVAMFLEELPERIESLEHAVSHGDIEELQHLAHQLRGAGTGYGFPEITETGAELEDGIREQRPTHEIRELYNRLHQTCVRALPKAA
jgi:HPt (histidine-containing phosphotransfer) domain-containing protein